jgi:hypothetical protein
MELNTPDAEAFSDAVPGQRRHRLRPCRGRLFQDRISLKADVKWQLFNQ